MDKETNHYKELSYIKNEEDIKKLYVKLNLFRYTCIDSLEKNLLISLPILKDDEEYCPICKGKRLLAGKDRLVWCNQCNGLGFVNWIDKICKDKHIISSYNIFNNKY